ncbi:porin family protein [Cyclobacterium salsum]|uniref:hypothetical protein n=1 Tax=Cyclobacterium salsum TaxID=2666329 RepID=UPI001391030B|nr:hypothetical protein [Cyclobacterium salsum]
MDGIDNAFYNPESIGLTNAKITTHLNYANGGQVYPNSHYPFLGITYRINDRLNLGISGFKWVDRNTVWTTDIAGESFSVDKNEQSVVSLAAVYEVIGDLYVGASGVYLYGEGEGIPGHIT